MKKISKEILKIFLMVILTMGLIFNTTGFTSAAKASDIKTITANKIVYVSMKDAFKYYGGTCTISGKTAVAKKGKDAIKVDASSKTAYLNSGKITMSDMAKVKSNDIYVPIDFLNEVMDAKVTYDSTSKNVSIKTQVSLKYSNSFSINYLKGGLKKVVDGDKRTIILVPNGKTVPAEYKNDIIINIPLKNVLLASTTQGCELRAINEIGSVTAVTTKQDQWQIKEVADAMASGKIKYVGENSAPDYEKIKALKPSIVFVYSGNYGLQPMMTKFKELNIKYAVCNEYLDEDPRGRMEWIKFYAAFYNKEDAAEKYFDNAMSKIDTVVKNAASKSKPKVAWGIVYNGKVYVAAPNSYVGKMIEMAGGDYIFKGANVGGGAITLEEFYAKAKNADILIYSSMQQYTPTLKEVVEQAPILANIKPVKDKKVWCFHPDYYQSIDKTDELITDLSNIFHAGESARHFVKYTE